MRTLRILVVILSVCLLCLSAQAQDFEAALTRLRSAAPAERVAALRQLARMRADVRAIGPMLDALRDASPDVRRESLMIWERVVGAYTGAVYDSQVPRRRATDAQ